MQHPAGGGRGDRPVRGGGHRPGQLLYEPDADLPGEGARPRRSGGCKGPIVLVTNLLTEGRGMTGFTAGDAVRLLATTIGRPIDVVIVNTARPPAATLARYAEEHKAPLEHRRRAGELRSGERRILVRRDRAPRSPPAGAGGVGGARAQAAVLTVLRLRFDGGTFRVHDCCGYGITKITVSVGGRDEVDDVRRSRAGDSGGRRGRDEDRRRRDLTEATPIASIVKAPEGLRRQDGAHGRRRDGGVRGDGMLDGGGRERRRTRRPSG